MNSIEQDLADAGLPPIATVQQLADVLGVTPRVVYGMNETGLPRVSAGRTVRYSRREIAEYLASVRRRGAEPAGARASRE